MSKFAVHSALAPAAIGPYSQAVMAGDALYVSGQIALDPESGLLIGDDIAAQTRQCLQNMKAVLRSAGMGMENVVKTTVLLTDMGDFAAMNEVYAAFFSAPYPARAAFQVCALPKGARVEIECVAVRQWYTPRQEEEK